MTKEIITQFIEIPASKMSLAKRKLVYGIGVNDSLYVTKKKINGKEVRCPFYVAWKSMIVRCYSSKYHEKYPTYIGCFVCVEWHRFSNFKKWMQKQDWEYKALDKDILVFGNKVYGPESCVFVDESVNCLLTNSKSSRGMYPVGVSYHRRHHVFQTRCRADGIEKHLGTFKTPEEASKVYKEFKSKEIKRIADLQSDQRVRDGLYRHAELLLN